MLVRDVLSFLDWKDILFPHGDIIPMSSRWFPLIQLKGTLRILIFVGIPWPFLKQRYSHLSTTYIKVIFTKFIKFASQTKSFTAYWSYSHSFHTIFRSMNNVLKLFKSKIHLTHFKPMFHLQKNQVDGFY